MKKVKKLLFLFAFAISLLIVGCDGDGNNPGDSTGDGDPIDETTPVIISLDKPYYESGGFVVIKGEHFGKQDVSATSKCAIIYQGGQSTGNKITQWSDTIIRFDLSTGVTTGNLYVRRADGVTSNSINITIGNGGTGDDIDNQYPAITMIEITAGTFSMGNDDIFPEASPSHNVTISYNYMIGEHEVTLKEYRDVTGINLSRATGVPAGAAGDDWPAHNLTFRQAVEFCNQISAKKYLTPCYTINGNTITCDWNANGYRLPTEAEWEYAARANSTTDFGTDFYGWCLDNSGTSSPKKTKTKFKNTWGLYDISGNVAEWCWDFYSHSYYGDCESQGTVTDPRGLTADGGSKTVRGGSIMNSISDIKAYSRRGENYNSGNFDIGFRVVRKK